MLSKFISCDKKEAEEVENEHYDDIESNDTSNMDYIYTENYQEDFEATDKDADGSVSELPEYCSGVLHLKLNRICIKFYPDLKDEYTNNGVAPDDPYAVFQFPYVDKNRYLLTFQ